mmetsp:Transcript_6494/g.14268  ORF Transcript_6494/g.14268 Transcript_6494/m.14268 type:complete len:205 (-) Transcript_6494:1251-1865(-)
MASQELLSRSDVSAAPQAASRGWWFSSYLPSCASRPCSARVLQPCQPGLAPPAQTPAPQSLCGRNRPPASPTSPPPGEGSQWPVPMPHRPVPSAACLGPLSSDPPPCEPGMTAHGFRLPEERPQARVPQWSAAGGSARARPRSPHAPSSACRAAPSSRPCERRASTTAGTMSPAPPPASRMRCWGQEAHPGPRRPGACLSTRSW